MSEQTRPQDDLDRYVASLTDDEKSELEHAHAALDLASLLYEARMARGLTQHDAASRSGLKQQAISRWETASPNIQLGTLQRYLAALGYTLDLVIHDTDSGTTLSVASGGASR